MTQPWEVLRNVPTRITDPSGRVTPLLDWHKGEMIAGAASPTMGIVLADDDKAGDESL